MGKTSSSISEALGELPPAPPLDVSWLRWHREADVDGLLESYVPATPAYTCPDRSAPVLVCLPGLGMDGTCFLRQLPLGRHAEIHLLRMPAYEAPGEAGLGHFARYVERYIRKLQLEGRGVILMGSSMGGTVALTVAARRQIELKGLILVGTFGHHKYLNQRQQVLSRLSWFLPGWLIRLCASSMLRKTRDFGQFAEHEAQFMLSCVRIPSQGYLVRAADALRRLDLLGQARTLTVPTLVLHAADDHVLPLEAGRELAQSIPAARLMTFESGGHAVFFLDHEPLNAAVSRFMSDVCAETSRSARTA